MRSPHHRKKWAFISAAVTSALILFPGCVDPSDPTGLNFSCAEIAPCADDYFCSPVLGICVLEDNEIPCNFDEDCPADSPWTCNIATELCEKLQSE